MPGGVSIYSQGRLWVLHCILQYFGSLSCIFTILSRTGAMELTWSVVTKHETIKIRMKELVQMKIPSNKQDKDEYCMDLAYAVREASLFRITGSDVDKGKKLLDQLIGKRCNVVPCPFVNIAHLWRVLGGCQEDLLGEIYIYFFVVVY